MEMYYLPPTVHSGVFTSNLEQYIIDGTIKLYLAAVRNLYITAGYNDPLFSSPALGTMQHSLLPGQQRICLQPVTPQVLFIALSHPSQSVMVECLGFFHGLGCF